MSTGGLSKARLSRMRNVMAGHVERGDVPGIVTLLSRRGEVHVERILSRPSIEAMTSDQLTPEQRAGAGLFLGDNRGWGFGVSVVTRRDDLSSVPGRYGWDGGFGTPWSSDPTEQVVAILLTQRLSDSPSPPRVYLDFWTSAYQTIDG